MELDNIEQLLERYFEANTTIGEEETLKTYFNGPNVAAHLEQYAPMFNYLAVAKNERFTKPLPFSGQSSRRRPQFYKWTAVAAVAVLLVGIYIGYLNNEKATLNEKEIAEAEYARKELKKALGLLAENFNRGTEKVAYLNEFEQTKQKIYNHQ